MFSTTTVPALAIESAIDQHVPWIAWTAMSAINSMPIVSNARIIIAIGAPVTLFVEIPTNTFPFPMSDPVRLLAIIFKARTTNARHKINSLMTPFMKLRHGSIR